MLLTKLEFPLTLSGRSTCFLSFMFFLISLKLYLNINSMSIYFSSSSLFWFSVHSCFEPFIFKDFSLSLSLSLFMCVRLPMRCLCLVGCSSRNHLCIFCFHVYLYVLKYVVDIYLILYKNDKTFPSFLIETPIWKIQFFLSIIDHYRYVWN